MSSSALPTLSSAQVKQLDELAEQRFGISVDSLMQAAGEAVFELCEGPTAVVCGAGNNGGDGLVCAARLHAAGRLAAVCCIDATRLKGAAARALRSLVEAGVDVSSNFRVAGADTVVDAIFGVGLSRPPRGRFAEWMEAIEAAHRRVLSVDVPSGLDADTGVAYAPCVRADVTVTFGLPKRGLLLADGPAHAGELWVADIGLPSAAFDLLGVHVPDGLFAASRLVRL